jgi:hypothetical protein
MIVFLLILILLVLVFSGFKNVIKTAIGIVCLLFGIFLTFAVGFTWANNAVRTEYVGEYCRVVRTGDEYKVVDMKGSPVEKCVLRKVGK